MSWRTRLNLLKQILHISSDAALAKHFGVTRSMLCMVLSGKRVFSKKVVHSMELAAVREADVKRLQAAFVGLNTAAVDGASELLRAALDSRNPITLQTTCHSLAVKVAHTLSVEVDPNIIATITSVYGAYPAKVHVLFDDPSLRRFGAKVQISHTTEPPVMFTIGISIYYRNVVIREYAFKCNDRSIVEVCNRYVAVRESLKPTKKKPNETRQKRPKRTSAYASEKSR